MYKSDEQSEYPELCSTESGLPASHLRVAESAAGRTGEGAAVSWFGERGLRVAGLVSRVKGSRGGGLFPARSEVEQR